MTRGAVPAAALSVRDLRVRYRQGAHAVRGVDLEVAAGQCLAVVGESGCGKTTVAHAVLGLLPAGATASGSVRLSGEEVLGAPERHLRSVRGRLVGVVGQNPIGAFDPMQRVGSQVAEAWTAHGQRPPPGGVVRLLGGLGIPDPQRTARRHPHEWSGGMLQRAAIAAARAHEPPLVLADEPTSALDADLADRTLDTLRGSGSAVLLITHDLALAARHADHVAVLYAGRVVETGPSADVLRAPRHPYTRALLASVPRAGGGLPTPLPGSPPDLRTEPAGCAFADRCEAAVTACRTTDPRPAGGVACLLEEMSP